ncbi:MAG: tyrosine-type recombinase/integrase [Pseudomonadota bacterium]
MELAFFNPHAGSHRYCDTPPDMMADYKLPLHFPFFVDPMTEEIHRPTFDFLRTEGIGAAFERNRKWHPSKAENRAYALSQWFAMLDALQMKFPQATPEAFRLFGDNLMSRVNPHTGEMLSSDYMYDTAKYVADAYAFAAKRGEFDGDLRAHEVLDALSDDDLDVPADRDGFGPRTVRRLAKRAFDEDQWVGISGHLGEFRTDDNAWNAELPSMCPRLGCETALQMGNRVSEVTIRRDAVISLPWTGDTTGHVPLTLYNTKGDKTRNVALPQLLLAGYRHYDESERRVVVEEAKRRDPSYVEPPELFLHGLNSGWAVGRPIRKQTLQAFFRRAVIAAGLTHKLEVRQADGSVVAVQVPMFTFHSLRHSFAIWMYFQRKYILGIDQEPWEYISARLGHNDISVTLRTYLDVGRFLEPEVSKLLRGHFHAACDWDLAHA